MSASFDLAARKAAAKSVSLRYIEDMAVGYTRKRCGTGFTYLDTQGKVLRGPERERAEHLGIPPAWTQVWIASWPDAHLLATGRDEAGRKQYIYHEDWAHARSLEVFRQLPDFARALPALRAQISKDLRRRRFDRAHVCALGAAIMDATSMRVGNEVYAEENGTRGLTVLERKNLILGKSWVKFDYDAKSGKHRLIHLRDARIAGQLGRLAKDLGPEDRVFWLEDHPGSSMDSVMLNEYIQSHTAPNFSAKDFRSWRGTEVAVSHFLGLEAPGDERACAAHIKDACEAASQALGNTPAVARKHYIHPGVLEAAESGAFWSDLAPLAQKDSGLLPFERVLLVLEHV